ncbi:MAG TPA: hypothetical protein VK675_02825, partial [Candidatus Paceibacterota bacterium]|nr:hypothetical protein [Candidatus Paceibacterota bacterium]
MKILIPLALFLTATTTVFSQGTLQVEFIASSAIVIGGPNIPQINRGIFGIRFRITAVGGDIYLLRGLTYSSHNPELGSGFNWHVSDNSIGSPSDVSATVDSLAEITPAYYRILEGDTETFQFTAYVDPGVTGFYGVSLNYLDWTTLAPSEPQSLPQNFLALQDFKSDIVFLQAKSE